LGNNGGYFYGCENLNSSATDNLDLIGTTTLNNMFKNAIIFNGNISGLDTSQVTNMSSMFYNATNFNQPLNSWNVGNVTDMYNLFYRASSFNQDISSWDTRNVIDMGYTFGRATNFNQPLNTWNTSNVINMNSTFYYASNFNQNLSNWDTRNVTNMRWMFGYATNFNQPLNNWNTSNVINMDSMFYYASSFNQNLSNWDTRNVTNMQSMFYYDTIFNGNISNWNTSKVTEMRWMFYRAQSFNQDISRWDVSSITSMFSMFNKAFVFNQNINGWNIGNVTEMDYAFRDAYAFNQNLSNWDTSKVTDMYATFDNAISFNGNISDWNTTGVTTYMAWMFRNATNFNQDLSNWDTQNVIYMYNMFEYATAFNKSISNWNTKNVTDMDYMFSHATNFNQNINNWNTSQVEYMDHMFESATNFNQNISSWNTKNVLNMSSMFTNALSFNQNIGQWNVSNVTDMNNMFNGINLSTTNYNALLNGWGSRIEKNNITFHAGGSKYSLSGVTGRNILTGTYNWTITDGGYVIDCDTLTSANTIFTLASNTTSSGTCFIVSATNVTIDCNGYTITGNNVSNSYGVYSNQNKTNVKNCVITNYSTGIYFNTTNNGTLLNNRISVSQNTCTLWTVSSVGIGIYNNAKYNTIDNNTAYSNSCVGIWLYDAHNNLINNSNGSSNPDIGIQLNNCINNTISNSIASGIGNNGMYIVGGNNNTINNSIITSQNRASLDLDSSNNTFTHNDFISGSGAQTLAYVSSSTSSKNIFCLNNFTATTAIYINDTSTTNYYNCTYNGLNQGNIYYNVINGSVNIKGDTNSSINGLYIGINGAGYPYNSSNSLSKVTAGVVDYAPLTNSKYSTDISSCANLSSNNTAYLLINNISSTGTCFNILANNVTINCNGYAINYSSTTTGNAVNNSAGYDNLVIKNCIIRKAGSLSYNSNPYAINVDNSIDSAYNITIVNTSINLSNYTAGEYAHGIVIDNAYNITINNVSITELITGVWGFTNIKITNSNGVIINNSMFINSAYNDDWTMHFDTTQNVIIRNTNMTSLYSNPLRIYGYSSYDIDTSNYNDGYPILFNKSLSNVVILQNSNLTNVYGSINCLDCNNVTYRNIIIGSDGLGLFSTSNSTFNNVTINSVNGTTLTLILGSYNNFDNVTLNVQTNNAYGAYSYYSDDNNFTNIQLLNAWSRSMGFYYTDNNIFRNYNITSGTPWIGISNRQITFINGTMNIGGIHIYDAGNCNLNIYDSYISSTSYHIDAQNYNGVKANLYNVTYNKALTLSFPAGYNATAYVYEYIDVNVTNTTGSMLSSAIVNATDIFGTIQATNSSSNTILTRLAVLIVKSNATSNVSYNNYTINASKSEYIQNGTIINVTSSSTYTGSNHIKINLTLENIAPIINTSIILPTPAYTNESLRGYCNATDSDNDNLTYYYKWYLNGVLNISSNTSNNNIQAINTNVANITNTSLAVGQNWTLSCQANDGIANSSWLNSSVTTINPLTPAIPTLVNPTNNNYTIHERKPVFTWTTTTPEISSWYEINITSNNCAATFTNNTNILANGGNYTPSSDLCLQTEGGTNTYYNWTVRACNVQACSNYTAKYNFSIEPYLTITLLNNNVTFPALPPDAIFNTTNNSITPFIFQNDGNTYANLTNITINQSMWISAALGTKYLQIMVEENESGSFNTSLSQINWTYAQSTNNNIIFGLNYNDIKDTAKVHVLIEVPNQEPSGQKNTFMIFNWI
jgi:surface protein